MLNIKEEKGNENQEKKKSKKKESVKNTQRFF